MAIQEQNIDTRLNKLETQTEDLDQAVKTINPTQEAEDALQEDTLQTTVSVDKDPVFVETEEPIQVAGKVKGFLDINKVKGPLKFKAEPPKSNDDYIIIPNATQADFDNVLTKQAEQSINAKPGNVKYGKKLDDYGKFNVNFIDSSDGVKKFYNAVGEVYQGNVKFKSFDDVKKQVTGSRYLVYKEGNLHKRFETEKEANAFINKQKDQSTYSIESKAPYDAAYIDRLLDPKNPTLADPEEAYRMLITQLDVTNRAEMLARKIVELEPSGGVTPALRVEFDQTLALAGEISKAVERRQGDIGRSLRMFGEIRRSDGGKQMQEFIAENGGEVASTDRARKFLALPRTEDKAKMGANLFWDAPIANTTNMWMTTWINGILSASNTHIKNMTANALFGVYQYPERLLTAAIGNVRAGVTKSNDYIRFGSILEQAKGTFFSIKDSARLAGIAFKQNRAFDGASKVELDKRMYRDDFDINFGDSTFAKSFSNMTRMWGKFVTMPGRALLAEDEFFKGLHFGGEFRFLANQKSEMFYDDLVKKGMSPEKAKAQMEEYAVNLYKNPPKDMLEAATDKAKELTFTKDLDGMARKFQQMTNSNSHPFISAALKSFFPFVRTPYRLVAEAGKRSPFQLIAPNFYKSLAKGGVEADAALAKATMGSGMIYGMSQFALEGNITGSGPTNIQQRKTLEATGWMPYSIVFKNGELSEDELEEYKTMTPVSVGDKFTYVSYQGLQPIASLMAIGATMGEYYTYQSYASTYNTDDMESNSDMMVAASLGIYNFISELPMLQGYTEMTEILAGDPQSRKGALMNTLRLGVKKAGDVVIGGSPAGAWSNMQAQIARSMDRTKGSLLPEEGGALSPEMEMFNAVMTSLERYMSRSPFYKQMIEDEDGSVTFTSSQYPVLDPLTGEEVTIGNNWGSAFNPYRTQEGYIPEEYKILLRNGVPVYNPPRKLHGYELSSEQYHQWIVMATQDYGLADELFKMADKVEKDDDLGYVQRSIRRSMTETYQEALEELITYYPELEDHLSNKDLQAAVEGLYSYY